MIRLVLADDHPLVLQALASLFQLESDIEVLATATEGSKAYSLIAELEPDIALIDIGMPNLTGLEILRRLTAQKSRTRVVLLTAGLTDDQAIEAVTLGAPGIVLKEMPPRLLVEAVRKVHRGERWIEKESLQRATSRLLQRSTALEATSQLLTRRELEIVRLAADGMRTREIADRLVVSEGTIKVHFHNIYQKLGIRSRIELVNWSREHGLI